MKVVAIIQARMGSSRLPGKVLMPIQGEPILGHVVRRALRIEGVDEVVVATSTDERDDPLVRFVGDTLPVEVFRGPENDVLSRYVGAAEGAGADVVVRLTADCPLLCPSVSSRVVDAFLSASSAWDYVSNTLERTYPQGLDTEVVSFDALARAGREATPADDREHVTTFIWRRPETFKLGSVVSPTDRSDLRLTVDYEPDLALVSKIYRVCHEANPAFDYADILSCLEEHPDWVREHRAAVDGLLRPA